MIALHDVSANIFSGRSFPITQKNVEVPLKFIIDEKTDLQESLSFSFD